MSAPVARVRSPICATGVAPAQNVSTASMSRKAEPKQFQCLVGERSLIQQTFDRLRPLAEPDRIFVATTRDLFGLCREHLPEVPAANILLEPAARSAVSSGRIATRASESSWGARRSGTMRPHLRWWLGAEGDGVR